MFGWIGPARVIQVPESPDMVTSPLTTYCGPFSLVCLRYPTLLDVIPQSKVTWDPLFIGLTGP